MYPSGGYIVVGEFGPADQIGPLPVFVNKVLLGPVHAHLLTD